MINLHLCINRFFLGFKLLIQYKLKMEDDLVNGHWEKKISSIAKPHMLLGTLCGSMASVV